MSNADFLVKGTVIGMIASSATVALVHFVIEHGTRWTSTGIAVTLTTALVMVLVLLMPPVIKTLRSRTAVVDPFFDPADLKLILQGRAVGILLGIVFGISVVTGWQ